MTEEALALNRRHSEDCFQEYTVGRLVLARLRWRPHDADAAQLRGFAARYPHLPVWEAMLASLEWELGNVEAARRGVALCARDDFAAVVNSPDFLPAALCLADAAAGRASRWQVAPVRAAVAVRAPRTRCWSTCGPCGARRRARWRCWPRPTIAPPTPPRTSPTRCAWRDGVGRAAVGAADDRRLARDRRPGARPRRARQPRAAAGARARAAGRRRADRRRGSDHHAVALDHRLRGVVEAHARVAPSPQSVPQLERSRKWSGP